MRLVGHHHDVRALRKHRKSVFILARHELLDGGEDNAATRAVSQFLAQITARSHLHRLLTQQILGQRENAEQLAVQVIAVGDHHDGRVFHRRFLHHPCSEAGHGDALTRALGMPNHPALVRAAWARGADHLLDGCTHGMELVIAGNLLHQPSVILEQHEVAQVVQQHRRLQHATHQRFQLVELAQRVDVHAIDGAPAGKALDICRQRAHACFAAVADHQNLVVVKDIRNLLLVGLDLVECLDQIRMHIRRVLQLQQHQRQAVDEQNDVRPPGMFWPLDTELIDRQPLVGSRVRPVDQPHEIAARLAILLVLHRHTADQQPVEQAIGGKLNWQAEIDHLLECILTRRQRQQRVEPCDGRAQAHGQDHIAIALTLGVVAVVGDVRAIQVAIANLCQPAECFLFQLIFRHSSALPGLGITRTCAGTVVPGCAVMRDQSFQSCQRPTPA